MVMKTIDQAKANFSSAVAYIPSRYQAGVQAADWLTPAKSDQAERNYSDGVGKAVAGKIRQKAIGQMSNSDWQTAAVTKGAPIIGSRISAALDKWAANFGQVYSKVQTTVTALPPSTTDYMQNINARLIPTVKAWKQASGKS